MLIKFSEQIVNNFFIPSFTLTHSEIVIIQLPSGPFFQVVEFEMIKLLTGKVANETVDVTSPLKYVEYFSESVFRSHFFPITVAGYLNKYANTANPICKRIYDSEWIRPETKVCTLAGSPRRELALYVTLSWTTSIIFDLAGLDPEGGQKIYGLVKELVKEGVSGILFDYTDEFRDDCTTFIQAKYLGNNR